MKKNTSDKFSIEVTSVPDREDLVAELWLGRELLAELRHEREGLRIQFYRDPSGHPWDVSYEEFVDMLQQARRMLDSASRTSS